MPVKAAILIIFIAVMSLCGVKANYVDKEQKSITASVESFTQNESAATLSQISSQGTWECNVDKSLLTATISEL